MRAGDGDPPSVTHDTEPAGTRTPCLHPSQNLIVMTTKFLWRWQGKALNQDTVSSLMQARCHPSTALMDKLMVSIIVLAIRMEK